MRLKVLALLALAVLVLVIGMVILSGCASADSEAARRANAEAARVRAEAEAYQVRQQADAKAAAERANIRQMERDAAHQRTMETLPFVLAIVGGLVLAGLAGLMVWDLRRQATVTDPRLLVLLERLQLDQTERDRRIWQAIAHLNRRTLPDGDSTWEVVIYPDKES